MNIRTTKKHNSSNNETVTDTIIVTSTPEVLPIVFAKTVLKIIIKIMTHLVGQSLH